jgi:D-alanyl-D-alanine carboxypeptidase (penicillin-binding protein 5/6)
MRHRVVFAGFVYACLLGVLAAPLPAQVKGKPAQSGTRATEPSKGKPATPGTKATEPSGAPRQEAAVTVHAKSAVLMEAASGQMLVSQNQDEKIGPASFVKVLTLYVVYDMLKNGKVKLTDEVYVSKKAWEESGRDGSTMFLKLGSKVPLEELIKGIAIVSGNDACVAVAEHISGSVEMFVKVMNETAQKLGMTNSHFDSPHGWPSAQQYTTTYDMAILARRYISDFPEALKLHSTLEYTYAGILQYNRNRLLRKDSSVDGLKTGWFAEAGYHLLATAKRDERRLIAVVMGAKSPSVREEEVLKLLNYGYRNFAFESLFARGQILDELPVWKGTSNRLPIVPGEEGMIVVPADQKNKLVKEKILPEYVVAPVEKNQVIGQYTVKVGANVIRSIPLVAQTDVPQAGFIKIALDSVLYFFGRVKVLTYILLGMVIIVLAVIAMNFLARTRRHKSRVRF